MYTADEIRKRLELVPFEGFARRKESEPPVEDLSDLGKVRFGSRMTGRTTRMLCSALAVASTGHRVALYAKPMAVESVMKEHAKKWAARLGLNPDLIVGRLATAEVEFFDHTWYGL